MRGKALLEGTVCALAALVPLVLSTGVAQAHDEVTIRVSPPAYETQRYYVSPPSVVVTPPPVQERVIIREQYPAAVYSVPPSVYYAPPGVYIAPPPPGVTIKYKD